MFHSARIKLTAWYLTIIMLISVFFSVAFFNLANREVQRIEVRIEREQQDPFYNPLLRPPSITLADLQETQRRLIIVLILLNAGIFIIAGGAGYFLAGRTLQPIQEMVDEQNRFITDASHELRTPITALRSEIEVNLRDKNLELSEAKALLKSNLEEVENLQDLSNNLLQLAQFQKPNGLQIVEQINLSEIVDSAIRKVHPFAIKKEITIENNTKEFFVNGDRQSLIQLVVILLDNAVKYSEEKKNIIVSTKTTDHSVLLNIVDQGIGIHKNDLDHIFDRFYRADSSRSKQATQGYGLGLSIAKHIVSTHHGFLSVKSQVGKGTTFTVQIPYIKRKS